MKPSPDCLYPHNAPSTAARKGCRCKRCGSFQKRYDRERGRARRKNIAYVMAERLRGRVRMRRKSAEPGYREARAAYMREYRRRKKHGL